MNSVSKNVVKLLIEKNYTISFAESCTGGLLASKICDVPGASAVLNESYVTYSNDAKIKLLGVKKSVIDNVGAVSPETAKEMAVGVRKAASSNIGIGITGIAGPDGGTDKKPVGLVYVGYSSENYTKVYKFIFKGSRNTVRENAANIVLCQIQNNILREKN